jgi:hypothetical protein
MPMGIGSTEEIQLSPINDSVAMLGKHIFDQRCNTCHTMEYQSQGPDLSDILSRRTPEWVMNFMCNNPEMKSKELKANPLNLQFPDVDCSVKVTENEARQVLEYFRIYQVWLHEFNIQ